MSLFEDDRYEWRETYFVLFPSTRRPSLREVHNALGKLYPNIRLRDSQSDEEGNLEILSVISTENCAGIDIIYQQGESVTYEMNALIDEIEKQTSSMKSIETLEKARFYDAKLEILHFEQVVPISPDDPSLPLTIALAPSGSNIPIYFGEKKGNPPAPLPFGSDAKSSSPFARKKHFVFDPDVYIEPESEDVEETDISEEEPENELLDTVESFDPDTLIGTVEILIHLSDGIAIDPSSGSLLG